MAAANMEQWFNTPFMDIPFLAQYFQSWVSVKHLVTVYELSNDETFSKYLMCFLKHLLSGGIAMAFTEEGKKQMVKILKIIYFQATKKLAEIKTKQSLPCITKKTLEILIQFWQFKFYMKKVTESVATEGAKQFAEKSSEKVAQEAVEEAVATASKFKTAKIGAKASLIAGVAVEGAFCGYKVIKLYNQKDLSKKAFRKKVTAEVASSSGSVAVGIIGGTIGTMIFPGFGTFCGNMIGGVVGSYIGSMAGGVYANIAFGED